MPDATLSQILEIYTDGGADPNPGPGGWGAVLIFGKHRKEMSGADSDTTNNRMELTAAIEALSTLKRRCAVALYTDSKYLKDGVTRWMPGWRAAGWQRKGGRPIKNLDLWRSLSELVDEHDISWNWLKGHAGHPENERADRLATMARRKLVGGARAVVDQERLSAAPNTAPSEIVHIYARSCALGMPGKGPGPAGYAAVLVDDGSSESRCVSGNWPAASSNLMDLWAVIAGLRALQEPTHVTIHSANKYVIDGATRWLSGWEKRHWRKKDGTPVRNQEVWRELTNVLGDHDVIWAYLDKDRDSAPSVLAAQTARQEAEQAKRDKQ